jgi:hypothetical protein
MSSTRFESSGRRRKNYNINLAGVHFVSLYYTILVIRTVTEHFKNYYCFGVCLSIITINACVINLGSLQAFIQVCN